MAAKVEIGDADSGRIQPLHRDAARGYRGDPSDAAPPEVNGGQFDRAAAWPARAWPEIC